MVAGRLKILRRVETMFDDLDENLCHYKHYGPVLHEEGDWVVMRCSFCDQIFRTPKVAGEPKRKSSRTCISACDWVTEGQMVRCNSCSYTGPLMGPPPELA